jgi:hypothetical protein
VGVSLYVSHTCKPSEPRDNVPSIPRSYTAPVIADRSSIVNPRLLSKGSGGTSDELMIFEFESDPFRTPVEIFEINGLTLVTDAVNQSGLKVDSCGIVGVECGMLG